MRLDQPDQAKSRQTSSLEAPDRCFWANFHDLRAGCLELVRICDPVAGRSGNLEIGRSGADLEQKPRFWADLVVFGLIWIRRSGANLAWSWSIWSWLIEFHHLDNQIWTPFCDRKSKSPASRAIFPDLVAAYLVPRSCTDRPKTAFLHLICHFYRVMIKNHHLEPG